MIEALYLHVPFCVSRCAYCDFPTSACADDARMDAYVDALSLQLRRAAKAGLLGNVKTIYLGGGTPTHLGSRRLNSLAYMISLSVNLENVVEFTCEANPESLDERMVKDVFALGVDRLSIGAQSFDDAVLRGYGRVHDATAVEQAVAAARTRLDNLSLDLICGGPNQDMRSWEDDVERAIELGAKHVSVYPLMLEEGTPLRARVDGGAVHVAGEEEQADMMLAAERLLTQAGMRRYEVASYAYPGFESRHNTAYWTGVEYLGLGAGAASMLCVQDAQRALAAGTFASDDLAQALSECDAGSRVRISASPDDIAFSASRGAPRIEFELLLPREARIEDLMLGMRRSCGVGIAELDAVDGALELFEGFARQGLVALEDGRCVPTQRGWLLGNEVFGAIWDLADETIEHI